VGDLGTSRRDARRLELVDYGWAGVFVVVLAALGFLLGA
jgi:hypothetical protein